jgi:tetratricopeptide (TPR) repeat protein
MDANAPRALRTAARWGPPALAALVFAPALAGGFVHDDRAQIVGNPLVKDLAFLPELFSGGAWAGAGSASSWYRPLMLASFALDHALFGWFAPAWHAVQLALFAGVVALAARLAVRVERDARAAWLGASLFAVHPVNAEAAAWLSARCDLLAAVAGLGALLLHRRSLERGAGNARAAVLAPLAFLAALLAKESALAFVPALVALDRRAGASFRPSALARRGLGFAAALGLYAVLRARALGSLAGDVVAPVDPFVVLGAAGQGLLRLVLPVGLGIAPPAPTPFQAAFAGAVALAAAGTLARAWRTRSALLVPLALGGASLALAAAGAARVGELGDRYLLLPALCVGWLAARGLLALSGRARAAGLAGAVAAGVVLAALSLRHVTVYRTDERLWGEAWRLNPRSARAALNLASARLDAGDPQGAELWLARAEALAPGDPLVALDRAVAAEQRGDAGAARRELLDLLERMPGYWPAELRLGHLALAAGALDDAVARYESTLRAHALSAEAWAGLGVARAEQGRPDEARAALARALALDPDVQNAEALRRLLGEQSRAAGAPARPPREPSP